MFRNIYLSLLSIIAAAALALLPAPSRAQNAADQLAQEARAALKVDDYAGALSLLRKRVEVVAAEHGANSNAANLAHAMLISMQGSIAHALYRKGNIDASIPHYQAVVTMLEQRTGPSSAQVGEALYYLARAQAAAARYADAMTNFQRGATIDTKVHGPDAPATAAQLFGMAGVHQSLGQYAQAEPLLRRALAIAERSLGPNHAVTGFRLYWLADFYQSAGLYGDALPLYERALGITEKSMGPMSEQTSERLAGLASLFNKMGRHHEALPLAQRSLTIAEQTQGANHPNTAGRLSLLADTQRELGDYPAALTNLRRAARITEQTLGPHHPSVATSLHNLGRVLLALGQPTQAEPLFRRASTISEAAMGAQHAVMGIRHNQIAHVLEEQGRLNDALPFYQRALAVDEKALGPEHPHTGSAVNNLAILLSGMGRPHDALPLMQRALAIDEKVRGPSHPSTAVTLDNLASVYRELGQHAEATNHAQRALQIVLQHDLPELTWKMFNNLQTDYKNEQKPGLAIFYGKQAVNTLQALRSRLAPLDMELQRSFIAGKTSVYRDLANLLIEQGRLAEAQHVLGMLKEEEFFDFVRRTEGEDPRQRRMTFLPHEQPWHAQLSVLTTRARQAAAQRALLEQRAVLGLTDEQKARLTEFNRERDAIAATLTRYHGELARALTTGITRSDADADAITRLKATQHMLASLGTGSVLVQYVMGRDRLNILLTTPTSQIAKSSSITPIDLNQRIEAFRAALRNPATSALPAAQALHSVLIAPIEAELKAANARTLMIAPDGALRYIPLAALHDGSQYLVERFDIALYTEVARETLAHRPGKTVSIAGLGLTRQIDEFSPLPAVRGELQAIVRGNQTNGSPGLIQGELHFDEQFNAATLKQALTRKHPLVHIASHFVFRPGNESTSFLLLGDGDRLTLSRIRQERLDFSHAELVTLSACETGVGGGRSAQGEEVEGLGALIQKQGAKGVIATLWPVADASTGLLMQQFYQLRDAKKSSKANALRQAQLALIQGKHQPGPESNPLAQRGLDAPAASAKPATGAAGYAHPYYWAPFILMGNWL